MKKSISYIFISVSYTHLDVYKRQGSGRPGGRPLRSVASAAAGRADVGIGPYETMKRNAAHKTADTDRHDR